MSKAEITPGQRNINEIQGIMSRESILRKNAEIFPIGNIFVDQNDDLWVIHVPEAVASSIGIAPPDTMPMKFQDWLQSQDLTDRLLGIDSKKIGGLIKDGKIGETYKSVC